MQSEGYTPKEVAEMFGMTDHAVRRKYRDGELTGVKVGSKLIITPDAAFKKELATRQAYVTKVGKGDKPMASAGRPSNLTALTNEVSRLRGEISELKTLIQKALPRLKQTKAK